MTVWKYCKILTLRTLFLGLLLIALIRPFQRNTMVFVRGISIQQIIMQTHRYLRLILNIVKTVMARTNLRQRHLILIVILLFIRLILVVLTGVKSRKMSGRKTWCYLAKKKFIRSSIGT